MLSLMQQIVPVVSWQMLVLLKPYAGGVLKIPSMPSKY